MKTLVRLSVAALALVLCAPAAASDSSWRNEQPIAAQHAMVVTEEHYASEIGLRVLEGGGNAADAAVAVGYALAVVHPCCGNIGGGGFALVRMHDGRSKFVDFREKAPLRAAATMYQDKNGNPIPALSRKGWLSIGVPGTVAGLERLRTEFGTMSRARLMDPAIALAQNGFELAPGDAEVFDGAPEEGYASAYTFANQANARAIFMKNGHLPVAGERMVQLQLAATLREIRDGGTAAFYRGPIARAVVKASNKNGGILSLRDFADYSVDEQAPTQCRYAGYDILAGAAPSAGGIALCEILNILSGYPLASWGWNSVRSTHYEIEAMRRAYADRNVYLGDPLVVHDPIKLLLSPAYAAKLRGEIDATEATPSSQVHPGLGPVGHEHLDTTHFSIVDKDGNAVALTYTINDWFGAGVIAGNTGFFLNDEMDDFSAKPGAPNLYGLVQGKQNSVASGKRPISSMTPTIVTKSGKVFMVTGSPGGSRITTIVLATLLNVIDFHMNVQQAVDAPRLHMQWLPDEVQYEPGALTDKQRTELRADGYTFKEIPSWGRAEAVVVDPLTGTRYGGSDHRIAVGQSKSISAGMAAGY